MLTSVFLEALNGVLFILSVAAVLVFGRYVALQMVCAGLWPRSWESKTKAAFGLLIVFSGEAIIRGWVWWWRHLLNEGEDVGWMTGYPVLLIGAAVSATGILCVIRHFSPEAWQNKAWAFTLGLAIVAGVLIGIAAL